MGLFIYHLLSLLLSFPCRRAKPSAAGSHWRCSSPRCTAMGLLSLRSLCWYQSQNPARACSTIALVSSSKASDGSCQTISFVLNTNANDSMMLWTCPLMAPISPRVLTSWTLERCLNSSLNYFCHHYNLTLCSWVCQAVRWALSHGLI